MDDIFLLGLERNPAHEGQNPNCKTPWNIAAVNRRWKQISLSYRRLWTNIEIPDSHTCDEVGGLCVVQFPIIRCYRQLERSRSLPLNVDTLSLCCECNQSVVRIAATQCRRWESFKFNLGIDECFNEVDFGKLFPHYVDLSGLKFLEYNSRDDFRISLPFDCTSCCWRECCAAQS
ncbi:hypothetical protein BDV98DRAFT_99197 [Pterulicium gracile]|uniref:F-box domain-containing protein n=1 Tax=Pterulicium gracile TaxID=1884261 RepID=A0A5C3QFX5_9AGAR|nr:hypothetical protein BDV98DRAFT_99197 [Pterula gracilis]